MSTQFNIPDSIDFPQWHKLHRSKNGGPIGLLMLSVVALGTWALYLSEDPMESSPVVVELSPDAPILAIENHYIYKFLAGDITNRDTPLSLGEKIAKRVQSLVSEVTIYDDFISDIDRETLYRRENSIPKSPFLANALKRVISEKNAIHKLHNLFSKLNPGDTSTMNNILADYYNTIGDESFMTGLEDWKEKIEQERGKYKYTYESF